MAEQLESLKDTFREHGRKAVVTQLQSCAQKVLRATAKGANPCTVHLLHSEVWPLQALMYGTPGWASHCWEHFLKFPVPGLEWIDAPLL